MPERDDLGLQPVDLGISGVGQVAGCAHGLQLCLELLAKVGVGTAPVEGGAINGGRGGQGLDVAFPTGWDVTAQEPVDGVPDPGFVVLALLSAESHVYSPVVIGLAASISASTRAARSYSA